MKIPSILFLAIWFYAFTSQITQKPIDIENRKEEVVRFQEILDSAQVEGSILIYDLKNDTYYSNNYQRSEKAYIPASTFKIPNTLIALETGVIENESTVLKWDGVERSIANWNQDLTLKQAFHFSCVPCYQEIARRVGLERMQEYTSKLQFGNMDVKAENLDQFWLLGESEISQYQEIDFLRRFKASELPISKRTENIAKEFMISEVGNGYKILSKTGWSSSGVWWYVGYLEKGDDVYFFATNLDYNANVSLDVRKEVTREALEFIGAIPAARP